MEVSATTSNEEPDVKRPFIYICVCIYIYIERERDRDI